MFKDGIYAAWFKTARGEGTGIVHFEGGRISGGDSILSYSGSYEVSGKRFSATVTTKRHTEGHATLFGVDDLELKLEGIAKGSIATCTGGAVAVPGLTFEATLIPCHPEPSNPPAERQVSPFDVSKFPRLVPTRGSSR